MDLPISITENRKAAHRLKNKSSSRLEIFYLGGEGVAIFGTKMGGSAI